MLVDITATFENSTKPSSIGRLYQGLCRVTRQSHCPVPSAQCRTGHIVTAISLQTEPWRHCNSYIVIPNLELHRDSHRTIPRGTALQRHLRNLLAHIVNTLDIAQWQLSFVMLNVHAAPCTWGFGIRMRGPDRSIDVFRRYINFSQRKLKHESCWQNHSRWDDREGEND
jgi:hypothetical protein